MSETTRSIPPGLPATLTGLLLFLATMAQAQLTPERIEDKTYLLAEGCPGLPSEVAAVLTHHPVIDTHAHTFNLGYLPIEGLLYRSRFPPVVAKPLAKLLERFVDPSALGSDEGQGESAGSASDVARQLSDAEQTELLEELGKIYEAIRRSEIDAGREPTAEPPTVSGASREAAVERILADVARAVAQDGHGEVGLVGREESLGGWLEFLGIPFKREDFIAKQLWDDHRLVDIFVHHMMDMEHVYADKAVFNPQTRLRRMARLDEITRDPDGLSGGATRFTVAFDPFRGPGALDQVREGIELGAVAIKFYPPSGYSPVDNERPEKQSYFEQGLPFVYLPVKARREQRKQWRARYQDGHITTDRELDDAVMRMFELAQAEDVPVFSHHTPVGFEASNGYAKKMAKPCLWRKVIEKLAAEGGGKVFRLVLGHAGGGDAWFGKKGHPWAGSFDQQAYNLCVYYPDVYCDFGYFHEILTDKGRQAFVRKLRELIDEREANPERGSATWDEDACKTGENAPPRFRIEDKMLFGTDWYMVSKESKQEQMVCGFARALSSDQLSPAQQRDLAAGFFGKNALKALPRLR